MIQAIGLTVLMAAQAIAANPPAKEQLVLKDVAIESIGFGALPDQPRYPGMQIYLENRETVWVPLCNPLVEFSVESNLPFYLLGRMSMDKKGKIFLKFQSKGEMKMIRNLMRDTVSDYSCNYM
jgi:hypothetical protein